MFVRDFPHPTTQYFSWQSSHLSGLLYLCSLPPIADKHFLCCLPLTLDLIFWVFLFLNDLTHGLVPEHTQKVTPSHIMRPHYTKSPVSQEIEIFLLKRCQIPRSNKRLNFMLDYGSSTGNCQHTQNE